MFFVVVLWLLCNKWSGWLTH